MVAIGLLWNFWLINLNLYQKLLFFSNHTNIPLKKIKICRYWCQRNRLSVGGCLLRWPNLLDRSIESFDFHCRCSQWRQQVRLGRWNHSFSLQSISLSQITAAKFDEQSVRPKQRRMFSFVSDLEKQPIELHMCVSWHFRARSWLAHLLGQLLAMAF